MFLRMFFVIFLTLFSIRLLLKTLGFEGYGIYDLIFGIVMLFSILSGSMATTLQRFYNVSHNDKFQKSNIYSVSISIFCIIGLLIFIFGFSLSENILNYLNIPVHYSYEAIIFFKLSVVNLVFLVFRVPFVALLISNEKMGLYASLSILDAVLKFIGVWVLSIFPINDSSLVVYGYILSIVTLTITLTYIIICYMKIDMPKLIIIIDKKSYKDILKFSGWTLFGNSAVLFSQQGLSVMLNILFGILVNTANAIAQQVYTSIYQFVNSFQTAYSPYLMQTYAQSDFEHLKKLIIFFSKFSVFLYLLLALPLFIYTEFILYMWLNNVPDYTVLFIRLTLVVVLFEVLSAPLWLTVQASGKIQYYQLIISFILLLNLPIAYMCFMQWKLPMFAFVAKICTAILAYSFRIYSVKSLGGIDFKEYIVELLLRLIVLFIFIAPIAYYYMSQEVFYVYEIILNVVNIVIFLIFGSLFILLNKSEYKKAISFVAKFFKKV